MREGLREPDWYAVQVKSGEENAVVEEGRALFRAEMGEEIFAMKRKKELKGLGNWYTVPQLLLPGFVFFRTADFDYACKALAPLGKAGRILSSGDEIAHFPAEEAKLLQALGGERHMIDISIGYKTEKDVHILSGPLRGRRQLITKINRHKRSARLYTSLLKEDQGFWVGLRLCETKAEAEEMIRAGQISFSPIEEIPPELRDKIA